MSSIQEPQKVTKECFTCYSSNDTTNYCPSK
jgi:hypothetical protein